MHGPPRQPPDVHEPRATEDREVTVEQLDGPDGTALQGELHLPRHRRGWGVLVLGGSSGRLDRPAAQLFAREGAVAFAQHWFGRPGLPDEIRAVPLELFIAGVDMLLARGCSRVAVFGRSRGAEAALLLGAHDPRVRAVFAISHSAVAWAGTQLDGRSSWTLAGKDLPFVAYDLSWWGEPRPELVRYREYHERSLRLDSAITERAHVAVEQIGGALVLVAGGDDALWPSDTFAHSIARRRARAGKQCSLITHPEAGHRILLAGETTPTSQLHAHGGNDRADAELGMRAWDAITGCLHDR